MRYIFSLLVSRSIKSSRETSNLGLQFWQGTAHLSHIMNLGTDIVCALLFNNSIFLVIYCIPTINIFRIQLYRSFPSY